MKRKSRKKGGSSPGKYIVDIATGGSADDVQLIRAQAGLEFDAEHAPEAEAAKQKVADAESEVEHIDEEIDAARKERIGTAEFVVSASKKGARDEKDSSEVPFPQWSLIHQATFCGCACLALLMLLAGAANIQGNLAGSGIVVFTLNPVFAWLFAALAPAAAMAIHTFGHAFRTYGGRQRYEQAIYVATGVCVVAWSALFAKLFHQTGGLDLSMEDSGVADTLFQWLQVTTEILVGSSLFLTCERIAATYAPSYLVRNRVHAELRERELTLAAERERITAVLVEARGQLASLNARREAGANRAHAEYLRQLRRFES